MRDDLLQRLRSIDPVDEADVAREAHAMRELATDIPSTVEPDHARRRWFPRRRARGRLAPAIVGLVLAAGILVPIAILARLQPGTTPGYTTDGWYRVGPLTELRRERVTYVGAVDAFVVAIPGEEPHAFSATSPHLHSAEDPLLYCRTSRWFFSPRHGESFDLDGRYLFGPSATAMDRVPLRISDGFVELDPARLLLGSPRPASSGPLGASGTHCNGGYQLVAPGIAEADTPGAPAGTISIDPPIQDAPLT